MILALHGQAVTYLLMAASIVISFYAFSQSQGGRPDERFLFMPYQVSQGRNVNGHAASQFSHGDAAHLTSTCSR
jgi:hypothetical protein